jgi:hypothetical protein
MLRWRPCLLLTCGPLLLGRRVLAVALCDSAAAAAGLGLIIIVAETTRRTTCLQSSHLLRQQGQAHAAAL